MRIEIHSFNGVHFDLNVKGSDTLKDVKQQIRSKENYPVSQQSLIFNNEKLEDDSKTLSDYKIEDGASIKLRIPGEWKIVVELMNDLVINLEINPDFSIGHIMYAIENKTQMRTEIQRLFLNGKVIPNNVMVRDTEMQNGSVLVCRAKMEIMVNIAGRKIVVGTKGNDFIKEVKFQIRVMEELRFHKQQLVFNGKELENDKKLCDYGIVDGSVIDLFEKPGNTGEYITVTVNTDSDYTVVFKINNHYNMLELKLALQHKLKIASRQMRLILDNRQLQDYRTLRENDVKDGDVIQLYQCMCGC